MPVTDERSKWAGILGLGLPKTIGNINFYRNDPIYYGLKQEIDELGESELGKKLNESVLKLVIDVVGLNPSESLESKAHNDNGPVLEGLKSIGETIKTIKNPT